MIGTYIIRIMTNPETTPQIVAAATRIVAAEGPDALTMERLARETGLSRATLYRRSGGREAVLDALAAAGTDVGDRTATRARILEGAREVFGRAGFGGATVDEVAAAAGVGAATVYRHFGDKDGLIAAFLDEFAPRRAAREATASLSGDLRRDLEDLAARVLTALRDDAPLVRLMMMETLRGGVTVAHARATPQARTVSSIASLLREHVAAGRLRDIDPEALAQAFGGMLFAFGVFAPLLRGVPAPDPAGTARTLTELFLRGALAAREER
jgi:TetR/AcrR family transcriptional regulator